MKTEKEIINKIESMLKAHIKRKVQWTNEEAKKHCEPLITGITEEDAISFLKHNMKVKALLWVLEKNKKI